MVFRGFGKIKLTIALILAIGGTLFFLWGTMNTCCAAIQTKAFGVAVFLASIAAAVLLAMWRLRRGKPSDPALLDPLKTVTLRRSRDLARLDGLAYLLIACGSATMGIIFVSTTTVPDSLESFLGWAILFPGVVFGLFAVSLLIFTGPAVTLSPDGIASSFFKKIGPIAWSDIRSAELRPYRSREFVNLELYDNEKYSRGYPLRKLNEAFAKRANLSPFVLSGEQVGVTPRELLTAITVRLEAFKPANSAF